jgi:outer membrane biosynthesis protein TonB
VDEDEDGGGGGGGGFTGALRQKLGPFPTWVYLLVITAGLLAYYLYEKHKSGSSSASTTTTGQAGVGEATGAQNVPDYVFQSTTNVTEPPESNTINVNNPPVSPPSTPAQPPPSTTTTPPPATTPKPAPKPAPKKTTPASKAQKYTTVTVAKWTASNTPWNSTLSGIASHYNVKGGYQALAKLNGIKDANLIQPGQKIKVPVS